MKKITKLSKPTDIVEDIFCNLCGMSCKSPMGKYYGLIEAEVFAGYESTHLEDGDVHKFSLCERCLKDMFAKFTYPSFQGNYMFPEGTGDLDLAYVDGFNPNKYLPNLEEVKASFKSIIETINDEAPFPDYDSNLVYEEISDDDIEVTLIDPIPKKEDLN